MVFCYLFGIEVAVVVNDGQLRRMLVVELLSRIVLKQKVFI